MKFQGLQYIFKGAKIYHRLKHKDRNSEKIVCPLGIGDTINVIRLLDAYRDKNRLTDITLVLKQSHQDIVVWYQEKVKTVVLSANEMRGLYLYMSIFHKYEFNHIFLAFFHRTPLGRIIQPGKIVDDYCNLVMKVEGNKALKPQFEYKEIEEYKKAVLLAPYSYTLMKIPFIFYEKIVELLNKKGISVYCNLQQGEKEIKGTIPLSVSLGRLLSVSSNFKMIISGRSGLCDALALCKCNLIVLYPPDNAKRLG